MTIFNGRGGWPDLRTDADQRDDQRRHQPTQSIQLVLPLPEAQALAQFVKRVGWQEFRVCAVDDEEAYMIRAAVDKLQTALAEAGFAPR